MYPSKNWKHISFTWNICIFTLKLGYMDFQFRIYFESKLHILSPPGLWRQCLAVRCRLTLYPSHHFTLRLVSSHLSPFPLKKHKTQPSGSFCNARQKLCSLELLLLSAGLLLELLLKLLLLCPLELLLLSAGLLLLCPLELLLLSAGTCKAKKSMYSNCPPPK